jgi:hypothetical protein
MKQIVLLNKTTNTIMFKKKPASQKKLTHKFYTHCT